MKPVIVVGKARVFQGDCREVLRGLPDNSVDSVVTDPPYELGFMGKKWDGTGIAYDVTVWVECLRVLKPGGHILAFGGSRTFHRMAVAIEDAGFEIRDSIAWMYGTGFPKSRDVSKAIDKGMGEYEKRVVTGTKITGAAMSGKPSGEDLGTGGTSLGSGTNEVPITSPYTPEAKQWDGWGTALKPAHEPIVVGRKPFAKGSTVAANVLEWGVGGLNIDASRIGTSGGTKIADDDIKVSRESKSVNAYGDGLQGPFGKPIVGLGRWPANVILDEYSAGLLDEQSGVSVSRAGVQPKFGRSGGIMGVKMPRHDAGTPFGHSDTGGASRFFYVAKANKRDRNEGLDGLEDRVGENGNKWTDQDYRRGDDAPTTARKNFHPTVKPTALMRYLIKLVTPAGGTVLDPFTGSGSTGKAALLDGYKFVGVELTEEYLPIIEGRLRWANEQERETDWTLFSLSGTETAGGSEEVEQ